MKKRIAFTFIIACALIFTFGNDTTITAAIDYISPMGAGKAPTIPILPPII